MSLFQSGAVILNSGKESDFKIECDDLSYADVECLCFTILHIIRTFTTTMVLS